MLQQIIALIVVAYFLARLFWQKQKGQIAAGEFVFWLFFWLFSALAIVSLKAIDRLVAGLGFSASGIQVLLYLSIAVLFYLLFRLRLRLSKMDQDLTKIARALSMKDNSK